jgi:hypothetical protein
MTMTTVRMSAHAAGATKHDCGCGCGGGCGGTEGHCCDLECLVRPNFYCGQLLTDTDLSAVVKWTRDRLSLSRYRDGWGVVCGLEVTCAEPEGGCGCGCRTPKGSTVWIDKGYAVDCCGNDLVVCEPLCVDLSSVCRPVDDPCADPCWPPARRDPQVARDSLLPDVNHESLHIPGAEQMIVDLYLRYGEQPMSGQRPLFRGACADTESCEPSRLLEKPVPKLVTRQVTNPYDDGEEDEAAKWRSLVDEQIARIDALFADADLDTLIRRLGRWRLYGVCLVMDYVRSLDTLTDANRAKIRLWLTFDWMTHQRLCECDSCRTDDGVRLARLWLWRKDGRTECCRTLWINNGTPFRRELQRDCKPASGSRTDLRRWFGINADNAIESMRSEGVRVEGRDEVTSREHLRELRFTAETAQPLRVRTMTDWFGVERVIGFGPG